MGRLLFALLFAVLLPRGVAPAADQPPAAVKAVDLLVMGDTLLTPGQPARLRILTRAAFSVVDNRPLPLARVQVSLRDAADKVLARQAGVSDLLGLVELDLPVPAGAAGELLLRVEASSDVVDLTRRAERRVLLRPDARIRILAPDTSQGKRKLRAQALHSADLRPVAGQTLLLRPLGAGGKVLGERTLQTDAFGVAVTAWPLPAGVRRFETSLPGAPPPRPPPVRALGKAAGLGLEAKVERGTIVVRVRAAEPGLGGACLLDLRKAGRTVARRSVGLRDGAAELRWRPGPEAFGPLELRASVLAPDGRLLWASRPLRRAPERALHLTLERDLAVYAPGDKAKLSIGVDGGGPASLALLAMDRAACASELSGLADFQRGFLSGASSPQVPAPAFWSNPLRQRWLAAQAGREPIHQAVLQLMKTEALGDRDAEGRWSWRADLMERLKTVGGLGAEQLSGPLGVPYTTESLAALFPSLAPGIFIPGHELARRKRLRRGLLDCLRRRGADGVAAMERQVPVCLAKSILAAPELARDLTGAETRFDLLRERAGFSIRDLADHFQRERAQKIYAALTRYGQENEQWFRVSVLDGKRKAWDFPEGVVERLVKRGLLKKELARDLWGRPFVLRRRETPVAPLPEDARLRFVELVSVGADGAPGTDDDGVYGHGPDPVFARMAEELGLKPDEPAALSEKQAEPEPVKQVATAQPDKACPPPLIFIPRLETDEQGRVTVELAMGDHPATYTLLIFANNQDGALGTVKHEIRVKAKAR